MSIDDFVAALPKVELHLHLVGSASSETFATLALRHSELWAPTDRKAIDRSVEFTSFDEFGAAYGQVTRWVADGEDLIAVAAGMASRLAASNVAYAEVTVTPLAHLANGLAPEELRDALTAGRCDALRHDGVEVAWIFDADGELGPEAARAALGWVLRHAPDGTVGFGLGGPERGCPRAAFKEVFDEAIAAGLHSVPHAGETDGPHSVWTALRDLRAERIGHGIRSIDDAALVDHLVAREVPLEVCPTSNVRTAAASLADSPVPALVGAGVRVTVATDNPGLFATDLNREYRLCHHVFGFGPAQLVDLARTGVAAAFCGPALKRRILGELDRVVAEEGAFSRSAAR